MNKKFDKTYYGIDVKLDTAAARSAARRMCGHQKLNVRFDLKPREAPYTDGKTIHIESPINYRTKAALTAWWAKLIHETRHNTPRGKQCFDVMKKDRIDTKDIHGFMLNLFEDSVVDNIDRGQFMGQDETTSWYHGFLFDKNTTTKDRMGDLWHAEELAETGHVIGTSFILEALARQQYMPVMIGKANTLIEDPKLNPVIAERVQRAIDRGWLAKLEDLVINADSPDSKATDVWEFTKDYIADIHELPPYEPPPESKAGGGGEGEGEGEGTEQEAQGTGEEDAEGQANKQLCEHLFEEMARDTHAEIDDRTTKVSRGQDMQLIYPDNMSRTYDIVNPEQFIIADYHREDFFDATGATKNVSRDFDSTWNDPSPGYMEWFNEQDTRDGLANEVKRYIQSECRTKVTRNKKKGKLDQKKLFKLGVPDAGKDWQEKVFWTNEHKMTVDNTVVSLLVDMSGSMSGSKAIAAVQSMDMIGDVCRTLQIDFEMAGFTTMSMQSNPVHMLFKPFGVKTQRSRILTNMICGMDHMSSNADGENILYAYRRIMAREAKRRVLIVFSDGYPAARGGDIAWYTKKVCQQIEEEGRVELHGIGILDDSVRKFYNSFSVLRDIDELEPTLMEVLKHNILRFI
jgi:hypothetical protein